MPIPHELTPITRALQIRRAFRTLTIPVLGLATAMTCAQVQAQELQFNIPAQSLASAIQELGRQANIQVLYNPADVQGMRSSNLSGQLSVQQAVAQLLNGSGIRYDLQGQTLTLHSPNSSSTLELGATQVVSNSLGSITEGSGSYTPGKNSTATRLVLTPRETPQSITVITRQNMDDFGLNSIDDVMRHTPGVSTITYDSERTDYRARGFSINNFQYDSVPTTRVATYSSGHTLSDMAIYDRVEVLKGATGLLTGTGTPGASINLIRKKPTTDFQGHITAAAGSWDDYRTEIDVGGALNDSGTVRGRAVAAYQDKHSYQDNYEKQTEVYYGVLEVDLTDDTLLTFGADYQDNEPEGSSWGGPIALDSTGNFNKTSRSFNNGANWSSWEQYTRSVFATLEHRLSNDWLAKLHVNHSINGYDAPLSSLASGNPNPVTGTGGRLWMAKYVGETKSNSADLYLTGPFELFNREHELVVGGSVSRKHWQSTSYSDASYNKSVPNYYDWDGDIPKPNWQQSNSFDETTREQGVYATGRFSVTDTTKLIVGARVSDYRGETVTKTGVVTPYLGVVQDLNDNFSLYASYTSIFSPQTLKTEAGTDLDPLEGDSYELGLKSEFFDGRLNSSLAYFEIHQDNYAVRTGKSAPDGTNAYRPEQGVVTKGYEFELSGEILPGWQTQAGYTHKVARRDGNKESTIEPENIFSLYTSYQLPDESIPLTLGAGARWQSDTWANLSVTGVGTRKFTQDDYWLFDLMARYKITKDLSATVNVNNLLDKKYYTIMDFYSVYSWGEPRNVTASIRWDF